MTSGEKIRSSQPADGGQRLGDDVLGEDVGERQVAVLEELPPQEPDLLAESRLAARGIVGPPYRDGWSPVTHQSTARPRLRITLPGTGLLGMRAPFGDVPGGPMILTLVIVGGVVVLFAGLLGYAATRPDTFRIERSATIQAPPEKVFALIDDFHGWLSWSPWEKIDPALKRTYSGPAGGRGAVYEWEGNKQVGQGRMEIVESSPHAKIVIKLDFIKPFEAHHTAEFALEAHGDSTQITWTMNGRQPFMLKVMSTYVFSMDKMVGKDFETGLANLKGVTEKAA